MRWRLVQSAYLPPNPPPTKPIPGWVSAWLPSLPTVNTCTPKTVSTYTYFIYSPGCAFWCGEQSLHVLQPNFCLPVSMGGDVCGRDHALCVCGRNHAHSTVCLWGKHAHSTVCLWGKPCTLLLWGKPCTLCCVFVGETMHTPPCVCGRNMHCVLIVSMKQSSRFQQWPPACLIKACTPCLHMVPPTLKLFLSVSLMLLSH